jgi:hypothetical protein
VQHLPPLLLAGVRFTCAGLVMLVLARLLRQRVQPTLREWRDLAVLAFFAFIVSNGLSIWALQWLPSNQTALLNVSAPLWIVLLGAFGARGHRRARHRRTRWVCRPRWAAPAAAGVGTSLVPQAPCCHLRRLGHLDHLPAQRRAGDAGGR